MFGHPLKVTFAEGHDPPEERGPFVHIAFWVMREGRKIEVARIAVPRALAFGYSTSQPEETSERLHS